MAFNKKIEYVRQSLGIKSIGDWRRVAPSEITGLHGIGQSTLDHIRLYLREHGITLLNDSAPETWKRNRELVRIGAKVGDEDDWEVCPFTVVIDSNEQLAYDFQHILCNSDRGRRPMVVPTVRKKLRSGDYSIVGYEHRISVERKSMADLFGSLTGGRDRLEAEFERLYEFDFAALVCEAGWEEITKRPPEHSDTHPKTIHRTVLSWQQKYQKVHWWFVPGRHAAENTTYRILETYYKLQQTLSKTMQKGTADGLAHTRKRDPSSA